MNGDGFDDVLIGAGGHDTGGSNYGASYVFFGRDFTNDARQIGADAADVIVGTLASETLIGGQDNDRLNGAGGSDVLKGGSGDDSINGDSGADRIEGDSGNDTLNGGDGADRLEGGNGADTLDGDLGSDILVGEGGSDVFLFDDTLRADNVDTIMDFGGAGAPALDSIHLDHSIFTLLALSTLSSSAFESGNDLTAATTIDSRIVYDTVAGDLYYDADGVGGAVAVSFATIATDVDGLSAADFFVD